MDIPGKTTSIYQVKTQTSTVELKYVHLVTKYWLLFIIFLKYSGSVHQETKYYCNLNF